MNLRYQPVVRISHSSDTRLCLEPLPACLLPPTLICKCLCPVHHRTLIVCTTLSGRLEIKHGRAAMLGFLHVIALKAGVVMPGYLSTSADLKFSDVPVGCFASLEAVPTAGAPPPPLPPCCRSVRLLCAVRSLCMCTCSPCVASAAPACV